jgi:hypothetical protein
MMWLYFGDQDLAVYRIYSSLHKFKDGSMLLYLKRGIERMKE